MSPDYGVTEAGFVGKPYSAILADLQEGARTRLGPDIDLTDTSPLQQFLQDVAAEMGGLWEVAEASYYAAYVQYATGANLDETVRLIGIVRTPATRATGTVTLARSTAAAQNYTIPAGTRLLTQDGMIAFETTAVRILEQGETQVDVPIQAVTPGPEGNVAAGTISSLAGSVPGIETATNADPTTGGSAAESDAALRYRTIRYTPGARGTISAIENALRSVPGVTAVLVDEDEDENTITATVIGGADPDIIAVLQAYRPAGIPATHIRPTPRTVTVTVAAQAVSDANPSEVQLAIEAALADYFADLSLGADVQFSDVVESVLSATGVDWITAISATDGTTTISGFGQHITVGTGEMAVGGTHDITVT